MKLLELGVPPVGSVVWVRGIVSEPPTTTGDPNVAIPVFVSVPNTDDPSTLVHYVRNLVTAVPKDACYREPPS